ncbi:MAG: hypothetical protein AB8G86_18405 [Saprospiraceae bacterium]
MEEAYIEIDLNNEQKAAIVKYASFFIQDAATQADLANKRKKWIRFRSGVAREVAGELAYHFNRTKSNHLFHLLDELIDHLEYYE